MGNINNTLLRQSEAHPGFLQIDEKWKVYPHKRISATFPFVHLPHLPTLWTASEDLNNLENVANLVSDFWHVLETNPALSSFQLCERFSQYQGKGCIWRLHPPV